MEYIPIPHLMLNLLPGTIIFFGGVPEPIQTY